MRLEAHGHPLHTRALSVVLAARADGKLDVHGTVLDLRKRGFVPVAGDLQGAGVIHDMRLAGTIDPASATLETLAAEQRSVAFEPSAVTAGESCRDPIDRIAALAGTRLRSEEHTSELQSRFDLVCRLLLEKKKMHHNKSQQFLLNYLSLSYSSHLRPPF